MGDNDDSASHRVLYGDCNRLFGVPSRASPEKFQTSRVIAMKIAVILALAFTLTTGMALTAAFGFGLLPLGF
jgi:hypothetical protein